MIIVVWYGRKYCAVVWNAMFLTLIASWTYTDVICEMRLYTAASVCVELQDRHCWKAKKYIRLMKFINEIFLHTYDFPFFSCTPDWLACQEHCQCDFLWLFHKSTKKTFGAVSYNLGHLLHNAVRQTENMGLRGKRQTDRQFGCLCHYIKKVMWRMFIINSNNHVKKWCDLFSDYVAIWATVEFEKAANGDLVGGHQLQSCRYFCWAMLVSCWLIIFIFSIMVFCLVYSWSLWLGFCR